MRGFHFRILAVSLAAVASCETYLTIGFRLEGASELRQVEEWDIVLGAMFALAFILFVTPSRAKAIWVWILAVFGAALVWLCVTGLLLQKHREQYQQRIVNAHLKLVVLTENHIRAVKRRL